VVVVVGQWVVIAVGGGGRVWVREWAWLWVGVKEQGNDGGVVGSRIIRGSG
jgi:hypothetical protein